MATAVFSLICSSIALPRNSRVRIISYSTRRDIFVNTTAISLTQILAPLSSFAVEQQSASQDASNRPKKQAFLEIENTKSWFQYVGGGFSIRVPPQFEDAMEPEDYNTGLSLYGDKVKPQTFAARFATPDGSEVVSVVVRSTNQLKITFLEAKDITDLGSLKSAAKIFVPGGANLYSARTIKIKEDENVRTYYYYEFGIEGRHMALVVSVNSGKAYIAGAICSESKWDEAGVKLRSAAISLSV
ncbi:hypothetical protein ZOSMA_44G01560 [Zostera marina]|uniref:PsbP C-terminal domain-containing protein n=1 Tax=Zostera marina TaxID=29655 RepID=A0A0K9P1A2_ZOSMR|nr:hypothetical protein ZOSMA_44G01560 [Zostera marina]